MFKENRIFRYRDICLGTTANHSSGDLVFEVIFQIWSIEIYLNLYNVSLILILLSGKFEGNRILGSGRKF